MLAHMVPPLRLVTRVPILSVMSRLFFFSAQTFLPFIDNVVDLLQVIIFLNKRITDFYF